MQAITLSIAKKIAQPFVKVYKMMEDLEESIMGGNSVLNEIQDFNK